MSSAKILLMSTVLLSLLGCGKSKDDKTVSVPGQTQAPQTNTETPSDGQTPQVDGRPQDREVSKDDKRIPKDNSDEEKDQNSTTNKPPVKTIPKLPTDDNSSSGGTAPGTPTSENPSSGSGSNSGSGSGASSQSGNSSSEKNRAVVARFDQKEARKTGGVYSSSEVYTGSYPDDVLQEFLNYSIKPNADQQKKNLNLARGVYFAQLTRNTSDQLPEMKIYFNEDGVQRNYSLKAVKAENRYRMVLKNSTGNLEYQGGFLKCLDLDTASCNMAYTKLKFSGAYTRIIFRRMKMDQQFVLQSQNPHQSLIEWGRYLDNTVQGDAQPKLASVEASSFEVVNGVSSMGVSFKMTDNEGVNFHIPLIAPVQGVALRKTIDTQQKIKANLDSFFEFFNSSNLEKQQLMSSVKAAELINNNGLGDLRIRVYSGEVSDRGVMLVKISPKIQSTMTLQQLRDFEAKAPVF